MDRRDFERARLALFARHGFDGASRWTTGRTGRRTYAVEGGSGERPTILVHGGLSHAAEWALVAGRLGGRLIIPDRPGCGLSYPIDYRGLDYRQEAADWLAEVVDGIGAREVDIVGNSMGGYFAVAFALAHPHRVRRLVLAGAPAGLDRDIPLFLRIWGHPILGPVLAALGLTTPRDPEALRRRVFSKLLVADARRVPDEVLALTVAAAAMPGAARAAHTMLRAVLTMRGWRPELSIRDDLARLETPALLVWGDADAFARPESGAEVARRMPNGRLHVIRDAGHLPYLDQPDVVADAVAGFLGASDARADAVSVSGVSAR